MRKSARLQTDGRFCRDAMLHENSHRQMSHVDRFRQLARRSNVVKVSESQNRPGGIGLNYLVFSFILLFVGVAITIVQYKVPPILEPIMAQFQIGLDTGSWLMSIFTAVGIVLSLPTGALTKKLGPKTVLLLGCAIIVAGSVVGAFAGSAWLLIVSRGIEGVAFVFITVAGPLAVEKYVAPEHQGTANGIWALWICFGSVIGSTATPMVFQALGLTGTWLLYAGVVVVAAIVLGVAVRVPKGPDAESPVTAAESKAMEGSVAPGLEHEAAESPDLIAASEAQPKPTLSDYLKFARPQALLYFFAYLVFNIEILAILSYTPTMPQGQGMDASLSGFAASLPGLLAAISSPVFGKIIDRTGRTKPFYVAALAVSAPATLLMLTQAGPLLWAGACVIGFIGYSIPVCTLTSLPQIAGRPELLPTAMGVLMLVQCLGEFLCSLVTPMLLGPVGNDWLFCGIVICVVGLLGAVALLFVKFK